tara:strand:+ start:55 stop:477 length:423 start_codon:yes stop_codon:yes gene_type:complete
MNLETIQSMWEKDSQIEIIKIHEEAAKIPSLHAKYWDVYNTLNLLKEKAQIQEQSVRLDRHNYYTGKSPAEVYQAEPFPYKVREKESVKRYMDADEKMQKIVSKLRYYDIMLTYLEDIVRQINNRSYQLKNIIDWQQLSG